MQQRLAVRQFKYSKLVLRVHGSVAIFLGVALTVMGWVGTHHGAGQMALLQQHPLSYLGLFQAYLLMSSLGVALWFGSFTDNPGRWHVIGFLAHTPPLAANLIFWSMITQYGITHAGVAIHLTFMLIEGGSYLAYRRASAQETEPPQRPRAARRPRRRLKKL